MLSYPPCNNCMGEEVSLHSIQNIIPSCELTFTEYHCFPLCNICIFANCHSWPIHYNNYRCTYSSYDSHNSSSYNKINITIISNYYKLNWINEVSMTILSLATWQSKIIKMNCFAKSRPSLPCGKLCINGRNNHWAEFHLNGWM